MLDTDIQAQIAAVSVPYTPGNGNKTVSTLSRKVFLLSLTELDRSNANANVEGTVLGIAGTLQIVYNSSDSATSQWTRSPCTNNTTQAWRLGPSGNMDNTGNQCTDTPGIRPAFTLPSSLFVDDNGNIIFNTPPEITGKDADLGGFTESGPTYSYTVTDNQSERLAVVEWLDSVAIRSYSAVTGAKNTLSLTGEAWTSTLNGNHILTITATDEMGESAVRTLTFYKDVAKIEFITKGSQPMPPRPTLLSLKVIDAAPATATVTYYACNNGLDDDPVWEDVTAVTKNGYAYLFTNTEKTSNDWAVRIKIHIDRGDGVGDCYISGLSYAYKAEGSDTVKTQIAALTAQSQATDEPLDNLLTQVLPQLIHGEGVTV